MPPSHRRFSWALMKTYKNLYAQVYDFANLYLAYRRARLGKRDRATVGAFEFDLEQNLLALQEELHNHTYKPGAYTNFTIHEPKRRLVSLGVVWYTCDACRRAGPPGINAPANERRRMNPAKGSVSARLTGRR